MMSAHLDDLAHGGLDWQIDSNLFRASIRYLAAVTAPSCIGVAIDQVDRQHGLAIIPHGSWTRLGDGYSERVALDLPGLLGLDFELRISIPLLHHSARQQVGTHAIDICDVAEGIDRKATNI